MDPLPEHGHGLGQWRDWKEEQECSEGEVQVSVRPPPGERHISPHQAPSPPRRLVSGREWVARLVLAAGESRRGREGDTYMGWDVLNWLLSYLRLTPQAAPELDG